jgi:4-hydroxybenzoate polyprenyltransferase
VIRFLLDTSFFTAFCALALCLGAERLMLGHIPEWISPLHALIIGSTLLDYNVHSIFSLRGEQPPQPLSAFIPNTAVALLGIALCLWSLPALPMRVVIACVVLGVMAFGYSTPLLPFPYKRRLKDFGLLKIHMLTGVWVAVGTIIPALYWNIPVKDYWIEILVRSLLIFPLCIAFDIRDVESDKTNGIHTIPLWLGVKAAYRAIDFTLLAFLVGGLIRCWYRKQPEELTAYLLSAIAAYGAIYLSKRKPDPFVYLILVDGVMCLYGLLQAFL